MHAPEPRLPGVSVREAAIHFGTSESDIRRRIKAGTLAAEKFERPGGTFYRVLLDDTRAASDTRQSSESVPAPEPLQDAPAATMRALEMAEDRLDFADALIRANGETIERLATENADLRERVGRAEQRADSLQAERDRLSVELERERRPWWRKIWEA